jgi:hypothetical protein
MHIPHCLASESENGRSKPYEELMHLHENPKQQIRESPSCRAALQISASSFEDLIAGASGGT